MVSPHCLDQWRYGRFGLAVDIEARLRERLQHLIERRDLVAGDGAGDLMSAYVCFGDHAPTVGDALSSRSSWKTSGTPSGRRLDVGLDIAVAERDRTRERGDGVLPSEGGRKERPATVSERDGAIAAEIGMVGGAHDLDGSPAHTAVSVGTRPSTIASGGDQHDRALRQGTSRSPKLSTTSVGWVSSLPVLT